MKTYFDNFVDPESSKHCDEMYFEFNETPLKWVVPIGVQFDTIIGDGSNQESKG